MFDSKTQRFDGLGNIQCCVLIWVGKKKNSLLERPGLCAASFLQVAVGPVIQKPDGYFEFFSFALFLFVLILCG